MMRIAAAAAVLVAMSMLRPTAWAQEPSKNERSLDLYHRGVEAARADRLQSAEKWFREATVVDPDNHAAWFQLGVMAEKAEKWQLAVGHLARASSTIADQPVYLAHLGRAYLETGSLTEAEHALSKSLAVEAGQYRTHYFLGRARAARSNFGGAASAWSEAARLEPCFTPAFSKLATLYARFRHWREAELVARQGLRCAEPMASTAMLWTIMGRAHERRELLTKAVAYYDNALEAGAGASVWFRRGMLHKRMGLADLARADLEKYLSVAAGQTSKRDIAARALRELGRR